MNRNCSAAGVLIAFVLGMASGCSPREASAPDTPATAANPSDTSPLETRERNGVDYQPAFAGQTRAPGIRNGVAYDVQVVASGLTLPWGVEPLPDGRLLVTEKPGRLRLITADGR